MVEIKMKNNITILPSEGKPNIDEEKFLNQYEISKDSFENFPLIIVGIRGFFASANENKRNIYDDAIIVWSPVKNIFSPFNGNTDPSRIRKGSGTGVSKGIAVLDPGLWPVYRFDIHNGSHPHEAICQRNGPVNVTRDGETNYSDSGYFGINIHRGGFSTTSSLGCQTIPPDQWDEFYKTAKSIALDLWGTAWRKNTVLYLLVDHIIS